jgi:molybdate transport system substrate-binding protein
MPPVEETSHCARIALAALLATTACQRASTARREPVRVAAAADLALAFADIARVFEARTGERVVFSFGSTGLLSRQIREGAPFDVFAAANVSFVDDVVRAGACDRSTVAPYALGRIAVWTRRGRPAPATLADLADPRFRQIAIANPAHAPYGQAARAALERNHLWERVQPKLVFGDNVRQTHQLATTGNVDAAIVSLSLVIRDRENPWLLVDAAEHPPIEQALVACDRGPNGAGGRSFARFVNSDEGRTILRSYGFVRPGEPVGADR